MKKRNEMLDLSVICIDEGVDFGKVKELIIDPDAGKVVYLIIDDGEWYLGAKLLEFDKILGIGGDAVTTQTTENIKEIKDNDEVLELVKKGIKVIGARVYTQDGEYMGLVDEFYIDEEDGTIIKCELEGKSVENAISSSNIITYGENVLVIKDGAQKNIRKSEEESITPFEPSEFDEEEVSKSENIFESRQKQFVLGRRAKKTIKDKEGEKIVIEGQIIDEDVVEKVTKAGKLVELTMNIE